MFFFGLLIFSAGLLWLPWFGVAAIALLLGFFLRATMIQHMTLAGAAGLSHAALAFFKDGQLNGVVGLRLAGLFFLPAPELIFMAIGFMTFVTTFLWLRAGEFLNFNS